MNPLANLNDISFGYLYSVPEAHSQPDYHSIPVLDKFAGTNLSSLNLFFNCAPGAYYVLLNMNPSVGDPTLNGLAVHVLKND